MIVSARPGSLALLEPADFTRFNVSVAAMDDDVDSLLRAELAGYARDGDAFIAVTWVRGQGPGDDAWSSGFAAMLDYAQVKGWLVDDHIQAHIVADVAAHPLATF